MLEILVTNSNGLGLSLRLFVWMVTSVLTLTMTGRVSAEPVSFQKEVWPILRQHCVACHAGGQPKGELRLDTRKHIQKGGESGTLYESGKPEESLLIQMVVGDEPDMPPKRRPLSTEEIDVLRRWVAEGAKIDADPPPTSPPVVIPEVYRYAPVISSVALNREGTIAAAACRSEVVLVDVAGQGESRRLATASDLISHVEFSPDGKLLVAAGGSPGQFGEVSFFNVADGELVTSRRVGFDTLLRGSFSPDGKSVALGGTDGAIYVVPVDLNADVRRLDLHSDWVMDVAYTPDGKMLISGGRDKATKISSVETGKLLRTLDASTDLTSSVAANAQFAISAGRTRTLVGFDLKIALQNVEVTGSGNGARPISKRAQYAKPFESQPGEVLDIATSGDRKSIAVGGRYGDVRVYKIADRARTALVGGISVPLYSIALNFDATRLIAGGKSGQLQIYQLPEGKLLKSVMPVPVVSNAAVTKK